MHRCYRCCMICVCVCVCVCLWSQLWAVLKWLNRSRYHLEYGLECAPGIISLMGTHRSQPVMLARPVPSRTKRQGIKAKATTERKTLIFNHIPSGFFIMLTQPKNAKSQAIQYQRSQSPNKFSLLLFRITLEKHQAFQQRVRHPCSVWADKEAALGEHTFHRCRACRYTQYTLKHRLATFELTPLGQCWKDKHLPGWRKGNL